MTETNVELLIGRKVCDREGKKVGRIEEIRVERRENDLLVESYLVGSSALVDRLGAWTLVRPIRHLFGRFYSRHLIPWDSLDLGDPKNPRLRGSASELRKLPS